MNKKAIALAAGSAIIVAVGFGAYQFGVRQATQTPQAKQSAQPGRKVLYWQDPMAPGVRFDKPGKSPYMDMDLVPVYAEGEGEQPSVKISPESAQNLGVRLVTATSGQLDGALRVVGNVAINERERVQVQARANGYVERLYVRAPLEQVRRGEPLLDLYVPDWVAAQEEYLAIKRMGNAAGAGLAEAALQRMSLAGMTDEQVRAVVRRGAVMRRLTVTAPADGFVLELGAREGMTVAQGAQLFSIAGLRTVWMNAQVPEASAAQVQPGTHVRATAGGYPGMQFPGVVQALLPEVDQATRTLTARIELRNPDSRLVPGMFVSVELMQKSAREAVLVPSEAVIQTGERSVVITALDNGKFLPVEVETGAEANGQTQVLAGLQPGQRVVASGQFLIDSEASLRGVLRRLGSGAPTTEAPKAAMVYRTTGRIEKIGAGEVTVSHGPVPGLGWGSMTMAFVPPAAGFPKDAVAGANIEFGLRPRSDGRYDMLDVKLAAAKDSAPTVDGSAHSVHSAPVAAPSAGQDPHAGHVGGHQ